MGQSGLMAILIALEVWDELLGSGDATGADHQFQLLIEGEFTVTSAAWH
jgi:hypothetical protein